MGKPSYASEWSGGFYPGFSGFRPPLMNDRLYISEKVLKGPKNPNQKKKKKKKKKKDGVCLTDAYMWHFCYVKCCVYFCVYNLLLVCFLTNEF